MKTFSVTIQQKFRLTLIDGTRGALAARYIARNCIARQIRIDGSVKEMSSWIADPGEVEIPELVEIPDDVAPTPEEGAAVSGAEDSGQLKIF